MVLFYNEGQYAGLILPLGMGGPACTLSGCRRFPPEMQQILSKGGLSVLFEDLEAINSRPEPFAFYTARALWSDGHISEKMLSFHLDENVDVASRKTSFIQRSVEWIASRFGLSGEFSVIDFGCGPGLYTLPLAVRGAKVTGVDFSGRSIQYAVSAAEKKGLSIDYVLCDYLEFETKKKFDLILMIMCDFCALSPSQRKAMLRKFAAMLKANGHVLLDVYSLETFDRREETSRFERNLMNGFWSAESYYGFLNMFK
ncbi:Ubiquinone biosynthesis O-methyltransferase [bioreactor metagenome]|uniref:Ubiquinone biosynthesis O-methyltransferase n=1 Tax=bioreactor metagenome TaxID=1076179 RepID=A0A644Z8M8_9ZZZZ